MLLRASRRTSAVRAALLGVVAGLVVPMLVGAPAFAIGAVEYGITAFTGDYLSGSKFRPGASVTVRANGLAPNSAAVMSLQLAGGSPQTLSGVNLTADDTGTLPANARVFLPDPLAAGSAFLTLSNSLSSVATQIAIVPAPTVSFSSFKVKAGDLVRYHFEHYTGVAGQPQTVQLGLQSGIDPITRLACVQADELGSGSGAVRVPAGTASGDYFMRIDVGNRCGVSAFTDLPDQTLAFLGFAVGDDAPTVSLPAVVGTGVPTAVSGSGFRSGAAVTCGDLGPTSAFRVLADGTFSGSVVIDPEVLGIQPTTFDCIDGLPSDSDRRTAVAETELARPVVTATLSRTSVTYGSARSVRVTAKVGSAKAAGPIVVREGSSVLGRRTLSGGATTIVLSPRAAIGTHTLLAQYYSTAVVRTLKVTKATSSASLSLSSKTVKATKTSLATVRVAPRGAVAGIYATGTVRIFDGSKRLGTYSLTVSRKGVLIVRLPKITKVGKHSIKAVYSGSTQVSAGTTSAATLTVTR